MGLANEFRGLMVNDRQAGNMMRALTGKGGTAFEWKDLEHNYQAMFYFNTWAFKSHYFLTHDWLPNSQGIPVYYKVTPKLQPVRKR